ncbi:LOW QUALITY PROTEIN: hypothetical protein V1477_007683 [Vespula maculifrons]|uniref:Uncharacterized protein n=1 Tax=Vespula maculifrons TaxID=7453 RepID=A0ABD2CG74_VESMC
MQCRDRRFRETTTKSGLGPTFKVTSSVVLWTSTRELRNFRGCHPCKLKCRLGILGFERRQQSTVFDRTLHSVVLLTSTGALRNLRGCHPCKESRLRETTTNTGLGLTFPVTTSIVLWTSTRELRNFRGCHPCKY